MDVVHGRCKADNDTVVQGNGDMMPWIPQKLAAPIGIDAVIEDVGRNVHEDRRIITAQYLDRDAHSVT